MTGLIEQMTARYYQYAPGLKAFLLQSGCPPHLAEDIVQEAFYRALKHQLLPLRRIRNLRPWLYKVSYNLYIDSKRRQRELPTDQELTSPGKNESPEDTAVVREQGEVAKKALSRLPERQRTAVVLCLVSGLSGRGHERYRRWRAGAASPGQDAAEARVCHSGRGRRR